MEAITFSSLKRLISGRRRDLRVLDAQAEIVASIRSFYLCFLCAPFSAPAKASSAICTPLSPMA